MKKIAFIIFGLLSVSCIHGQVQYSNIDFSLKTTPNEKGTELICGDSSFSIRFQLKPQSVEQTGNFLKVASHVIQILPLKVSGHKKNMNNLDTAEQRKLLSAYAKYEMDYFTKELKVQVINPNSQFVPVNSRYWYIWYFRVGNTPDPSDKTLVKKVTIQLFATTLIGDKIVNINAPMMADNDFTKSASIVNELMETLTILQ